jgi:hypothetical protein
MIVVQSAGILDPELTALAERHGSATAVIVGKRLSCSQCGARDADFVVSGAEP